MSKPHAPLPDQSKASTFADRLFQSSFNDKINRFHRILSTPAGTEALLALISHSSLFIHSQLHRVLEANLRVLAVRAASDISSTLQPGETFLTSLYVPAVTRRLADIHEGSRALEHIVEDVRAFTRLFSLLGLWRRARKTYYQGPRDRVLRSIVWSQIYVDALATVIEGPAFLASKGVVRGWSEKAQQRWLRWSAQCFIAHLVLDFVKLWRKSRVGQESEEQGTGGDTERVTMHKEKEEWWRDFYIASAYSPLSIHWSMKRGYVSELGVGILGTIAAYFEFKEAWEEAGEDGHE